MSGDVPDVVQMDRTYVGTYAAQGLILPMDKCFSAWGIDPTKQYYPAADNAIRTKNVKSSGNKGFDETIATYYEVLPQGKSLGSSPAGQAIDTELKNAISSTLLGKKSPDEALADAQTAAKRAYDQVAG